MTLSTENDNFIIHVLDEYDYKFDSEKCLELLKLLKRCYFELTKQELPIYAVQNVGQFTTTKLDKMAGRQRRLPYGEPTQP